MMMFWNFGSETRSPEIYFTDGNVISRLRLQGLAILLCVSIKERASFPFLFSFFFLVFHDSD